MGGASAVHGALGPAELRVLGCLLEKQRTTPEGYPLSLNALRLACNQSTNRDPVVDYEEETVRGALERLARRRLTRTTSGHHSRVPKYRHLLDDALGLPEPALSVLAVLMLRGPQTPGELRSRVERLHEVPDSETLDEALSTLAERGLAERLQRRPGQKEARHRHLLGAEDEEEGEGADGGAPSPAAVPAEPEQGAEALDSRVIALEKQLAAVQEELADLRTGLDALHRDLGA